jgi:amino acid transporter
VADGSSYEANRLPLIVYVTMMFLSYLIICLPTKYVSWFNIGATVLGTIVLFITTILLPIKAAPNLNSAKDIFTNVSAGVFVHANVAEIVSDEL